ncbi:MAG: winged helix-turn-helix domain-containing protein [Candidatus Edwardsbacteria bacterium]|nr:winged helix-turn-helix domain-containing protein [Candidatus Edwardsbacteria bacterium]
MWGIKIGENAGAIWRELNAKGEQNISALKRSTGLDDKNLYLALGWLAKENKIIFSRKQRQILIGLIG